MCRQPPLFHCFFFLLWSLLKFIFANFFHLLVLIMDAATSTHSRYGSTSVQQSTHIQNGTELYIVQLVEMDCLNKINLWMMENLF